MKFFFSLMLFSIVFQSCNTENGSHKISTTKEVHATSPTVDDTEDITKGFITIERDYSASDNNSLRIATEALAYQNGNTSRAPKNQESKESGKLSEEEAKLNVKNKVIMTAHLRAEVKDYTKIYYDIKRFVSLSGGYIANENEEKTSYYVNNNLIIKIPMEYFSAMVDSIEHHVPNLLEKRIVAEDVTASFYDLEARINTKKNIEQRYLSILNKAKTIKEILKVEHEIGMIREDIESSEGKLKLMSKLIRYSTIYLTINQPFNKEPSYADTPTFWTRSAKGLAAGWDGILSIIVGITYLWPLLLLTILGTMLIRRVLKNKWKIRITQTRAQ